MGLRYPVRTLRFEEVEISLEESFREDAIYAEGTQRVAIRSAYRVLT